MTTATDLLSQALLPESMTDCIEDLERKTRWVSSCEAVEILADIVELRNLRRHMRDPHNAAAHELFRARKQTTRMER